MPDSAHRDALTLGLGNGINALSQGVPIGLLALFAEEADVGHLAAAVAVTTPIMFFVQGRVQDLIATSGSEIGETVGILRPLVANGIAWGTAASMLTGVALGLRGTALATVLFYALARGAEAGSQISYGCRLHRNDARGVAKSLLVRSALTVTAAVLLLAAWKSSAAAGLAIFCAWLATFVLLDRPAIPRNVESRTSARRQVRLHARRLGAAHALSALVPSIPRIGLLVFSSASTLGQFAVVAFVALAPAPVPLAMSQAAGPAMAADHRAGRRPTALRHALLRNAAFAVLWLPMGSTVVASLIPWLLGDRYDVSTLTTFSLLVAFGCLFVAVTLDQFAIAAQETAGNLRVLIVTATVCLVATLALVSWGGIEGAALAVLAANIVRLTSMGTLVRRRLVRTAPR